MDVRKRGSSGGASDADSPLRTQRLRRALSGSKIFRGSRRGLALKCLLGISLSFVVASCVYGFTNYEKSETSNSVRGMKEQQQDERVDRKLYNALQQQNKALHEQIINLQKHDLAAKTAKLPAASEDKEKLIKTVARLTPYKQRMHEMIQLISKRQLLLQYGKGPHFVEILVSYDRKSNVADPDKDGDDTDVLLIQLAPVDEMPATVFWFLEQVNGTLFDGCSFHRNAGHVVQGGPAPNFETVPGAGSAMLKFTETGLGSVPFQE